MPHRKPNLLWRTRKPIHASMQDTCQLQTIAPSADNKFVWITVASGETSCIERIGKYLSDTRFQLFPLQIEAQNADITQRRAVERKPPRRMESRRSSNEQQQQP